MTDTHAALQRKYLKYPGTCHAETSYHDWQENQHRDTLSLYLSQPAMMMFFSLTEKHSLAQTRYNFLTKMELPCGPPPTHTPAEVLDRNLELFLEDDILPN